jgi:hypothetical protein
VNLGGDDNDTFHGMTDWKSYGNLGAMETCSAMTVGPKNAFVVGSVEKGGWLHDTISPSEHPLLAFVADLDPTTLDVLSATTEQSSEEPLQKLVYPISVIHEGRILVVAALTSSDAEINARVQADMVKNPKKEFNWQMLHKYGQSFHVSVFKLRLADAENRVTTQVMWHKEFPVDVESDGETIPPVFLGGMILQKDVNGMRHVVIAGSTRGTGRGYGPADPNTIDEDGFLMQLNYEDGEFLKNYRVKGLEGTDRQNDPEAQQGTNNLREGTESDDFVKGMCQRSLNNNDKFYIVGGTRGDMTTNGQGDQNGSNAGFQFGINVENKYMDLWKRDGSIMPFLRQVSFERELGPVWTTQWAAMPSEDKIIDSGKSMLPTTAFAVDCAVDESSNVVYVVGEVQNNAAMTQGDIEMINQGGHDVWVAKIDELTGNVFWLTQLGTYANELLAEHKSISVTPDGNVIIYGTTHGNMYRQRPDNDKRQDVFLVTVNGRTGAVTDNFYLGGTSSATVAGTVAGAPDDVIVPGGGLDQNDNDSVPPVFDDDDDDDDYTSPTPPSSGVPPPSKPDVVTTTTVSEENSSSSGSAKVGVVIGFVFAFIAALASGFFFMKGRGQKHASEKQKSSIFSCLQQFDVEDIDLRRSPPGGWHGTYLNKLAYGNNIAGQNEVKVSDGLMTGSSPSKYEDVPLTGSDQAHSSVVSDSLFMDTKATPSLSVNDGGLRYRDNASTYNLDEDDAIDIHLKGKDLI